jgi:hypothetical protein
MNSPCDIGGSLEFHLKEIDHEINELDSELAVMLEKRSADLVRRRELADVSHAIYDMTHSDHVSTPLDIRKFMLSERDREYGKLMEIDTEIDVEHKQIIKHQVRLHALKRRQNFLQILIQRYGPK